MAAWLLTDNQTRLAVFRKRGIARAQLRKVVEEGDGECQDETHQAKSFGIGVVGERHVKRRHCDPCWAELRKEAGLD